jgi:hypothetical protein
VKRTINFTKRKSLTAKNFSVAVDLDVPERPVTPVVMLEDEDLPPDGRLFLEAFHREFFQRFDLGTVGTPSTSNAMGIADCPNPGAIQFRLKVVDPTSKHIVAHADGVHPQLKGAVSADRDTILEVEKDDLEEEVWQLSFPDDVPVLRVNMRIDGIKDFVRTSAYFHALVYPEIVRQILRRIVIEERSAADTDASDDQDWRRTWLRFVATFFLSPPPRVPPPIHDRLRSRKPQCIRLEWLLKLRNPTG